MIAKNTIDIKSGIFLLSDPFLQDEYFGRSVVLLCNHNIEGSFGYIINKRLEMKINDVIEGFPQFDAPVYYGGPMDSHTLHYLHSIDDLEDRIEIEKGIYWSGDYEQLKERIRMGKVEPDQIKFLLGYSGWSFGQIEEELKEDSWILTESHPQYVFGVDDKSLWKNILNDMGGEFKLMANYPESPLMN